MDDAHHDRSGPVLMSAEQRDGMAAATRRAMRTSEAPDVVLKAVRRAEMAPEQVALDDLMDE
jgi:glycogen synthase